MVLVDDENLTFKVYDEYQNSTVSQALKHHKRRRPDQLVRRDSPSPIRGNLPCNHQLECDIANLRTSGCASAREWTWVSSGQASSEDVIGTAPSGEIGTIQKRPVRGDGFLGLISPAWTQRRDTEAFLRFFEAIVSASILFLHLVLMSYLTPLNPLQSERA